MAELVEVNVPLGAEREARARRELAYLSPDGVVYLTAVVLLAQAELADELARSGSLEVNGRPVEVPDELRHNAGGALRGLSRVLMEVGPADAEATAKGAELVERVLGFLPTTPPLQ